jgi:hypothetical protein
MSKLARSDEPKVNQVQIKCKAQMTKLEKERVLTLSCFCIHLAFACLREAATAKAGILTFELSQPLIIYQ